MMNSALRFSLLFFLLGLVPASDLRAANPQDEGSDAGSLLTTAGDILDKRDLILGNVTFAGDCDLYCFYLPVGRAVTIEMKSTVLDSNLILFDALGRGLAGDDDGFGASGGDSRITITLTAGIYYVACGHNNMEAYDNPTDFAAKNANYFISNDSGNLGSPTAKRLYGVATNGTPTGAYTLEFDFLTGKPGCLTDARCGKRRNPDSHKGDGTYNNTGASQKVTIQKPRKRKISCYFSCENDATYDGPITFKPKGLNNSSKFRHRVFDVSPGQGKKNITAESKKGFYYGYLAGEMKNICIEVKNKRPRRATARVKLDCTSGDYRDLARCDLKFK